MEEIKKNWFAINDDMTGSRKMFLNFLTHEKCKKMLLKIKTVFPEYFLVRGDEFDKTDLRKKKIFCLLDVHNSCCLTVERIINIFQKRQVPFHNRYFKGIPIEIKCDTISFVNSMENIGNNNKFCFYRCSKQSGEIVFDSIGHKWVVIQNDIKKITRNRIKGSRVREHNLIVIPFKEFESYY